MILKWLGHSCFLLTSEAGVRILMDPCAPSTGYTVGPVAVDAVTASHGHYDHNYFEAALGNPVRITEPGLHEVKGVRVTGIPTWHDKECGAKRGRNIMFLVEMDGLRLLHAGDLGHLQMRLPLLQSGRWMCCLRQLAACLPSMQRSAAACAAGKPEGVCAHAL